MAYEPLHRSPAQTQCLTSLIEHCEACGANGRVPVVVFDLDGCVFDNRPRQVQIIREFAAQHGEYELYALEAHHIVDWHLSHALRNAGVAEESIQRVKDRLSAYWHRQFFRSSYTLYDHAMPGAPQFVWRTFQTAAHVVYLTGRDESMRSGTVEALMRFGFPFHRPRTTLIHKPDFASDDLAFKSEALREIATLGEPVVFLDNEPGNLNIFVDAFPEARVVMVETDHSPRPTRPYEHIPRIKGFLL